jgi:acyl-CoA synthetase (NDP forming)
MSRLDRLFRPKSIAVVGGGVWGASVIEQCQKIGFEGDIWPVHPKRDTVSGLRVYPGLDALPGVPDATFVGVNRNSTIDIVAQLSAMGAGGAICFASGFLEAREELADGAEKQEALLAAAGDMKIVGPNCYGILNYLDGAALWPDQHGGARVKSGVAIITQSSNIAINLTMQKRGLPLAYVVTAGNQAQTDLSEIGIALLQDSRVTALGLHIEGIDDLRGFEALAAEAHKLGKSIIAVKVGKSDQAQAATVSHTASLAGSDAGARALLKRLGIGRVSSLAALLETLKILHVAGPLSSGRIASMSCSGGEASLMADAAHGTDLTFPPLNTGQRSGLRKALGPLVALANPLDYHTYIWGDECTLAQTFTAMMESELALGVVILDFPRADRCSSEAWEYVVNAVARTKEAIGKPMAVLGSLTETMPEDVSQRLVDMGIIPLCGMAEAIEAIDVAADIGRRPETSAPILLPVSGSGAVTLSEAEAKKALALYGVRVPDSARVKGSDEAALAATNIGLPVALKGEGIAHKTEAGAVALNLFSAGEVEKAANRMPCNTFFVEEMITDTVVELLVGIVCDPAHGYVLTLAAGGILTELLADSSSLLVPAGKQEILTAIDNLKVSRLLYGYRGGDSADKGAIVDAVMAMQNYVIATLPQEVEINPLMCGPDKAVAADALIKTGESNDR